MPYAVMQKTVEPPSLEQLKRAFQRVKGLTAADAQALGNNAFGILARNLPMERATALKDELKTEGVEAEAVEEGSLPKLPPAKFVTRVECGPEALLIYDPLGRSFPLEWKNIMLVAAGRVATSDFNRIRTEVKVMRPGGRGYKTVTDYRSKEERHDAYLLEIVVSRAALRFSIEADRPGGFLFQYLGGRKTDDLGKNFTLLALDVMQAAPQAALNRGANSLKQQSERSFNYPGKGVFFEEIVWLLWQLSGLKG